MKADAVFAVPGDLNALTGGYIYEKQLLLALRRRGLTVAHLGLPGSYPDPTPADLAVTGDALAGLDPGVPVILDGFLPGATPPDVLARLKAPFVAVTHHPLALETGVAPARAAELHAIEGANLARAAHVIVPSPLTARTLMAEFGLDAARITVATPGVRDSGAALPPVPRGPGAEPLILSVGQLVPRKGHDILLRALAEVADLPWQAEIVGGGSDARCAADLRALCRALRLETRVRFAGEVAPALLQQSYARAALFALATHYEGYGMVFAEALLAGLPIVACAGGAVADTVPSDAGLLVPPGDVAGFAGALRRLLSEPGTRSVMAAAALDHGMALPSWDDNAAIVARVLERLRAG